MRFFVKENVEAERKIENLIERVKSEILNYFNKDIVSISLIGSFAVGEGVLKKKNGEVKIISDLDLFVITKIREKIPKKLEETLKDIEDETGITVDLKIKRYIKLRFLPKDTHTLDIKKSGIVIHGKDVVPVLPEFEEGDITSKDIFFLFFNRIILSIEEYSPGDIAASHKNKLERLSHEASKTMFTCADMIGIHHGNYPSSIVKRVKFVENKLGKIKINKEKFLKDLNTALKFRFEETNKLYLENAHNYWFRARNYLINLFIFFLEEIYHIRDISKYPYLESKNTSFRREIRSIYKSLQTIYILLKMKKVPKFLWKIRPSTCCKMASLMLYMAIDNKIERKYVMKAEEYLSKVYFRRKNWHDTKGTWILLRDELIKFHKLGIF